MKRILIINPFGIGDVLFTTPLILALTRALPSVEIGYLVNRRCELLMRQFPQVKFITVYERDEFVALKKKNILLYWQRCKALVDEIHSCHYDLSIDCSLNSLYGIISFFAGIKRRVGYDYKGRGGWLTDRIKFKGYEQKHVIEFYHDLLPLINVSVGKVDRPFLPVAQEQMQQAHEMLKCQGVDLEQQGAVVIVPGGGGSWGKLADQKRWPINNFMELADKIVEELNMIVILVGSSDEQKLCDQIVAVNPKRIVSFAGKTSLIETAAMMKLAGRVIANDGGPMHMAVAVGAKVAGIFGPVDPRVYGPYPLTEHMVLSKNLACQPCYQRFRMSDCAHLSCLNQFSVDEVYRKVNEVL